VEVYYFTFTGTSKQIAEEVVKKVGGRLFSINSVKLPYVCWLFLSFFPGLKLKSSFKPPTSKRLVVCFPKWTTNCPPVTYFFSWLKKNGYSFDEVNLIISYKGWKKELYLNHYSSVLKKLAKKVNFYFLKQKNWKEEIKNLVLG